VIGVSLVFDVTIARLPRTVTVASVAAEVTMAEVVAAEARR